MRKWGYSAIATVGSLGLVLTVLLISGVVRFGGTNAVCSKLAVPPGEGPFIDGRATTVAAAQIISRFPVLIPDAPAARLSNLTQTWVAHRSVALIFGQGKAAITITMTRANYGNALKDFQRFARQNHAATAIGHVHGQPALVITPRSEGCGSNPAWVEFKHQGIDVNISSYSYDTGTLLAVADSLRQRAFGPG
jgi:hypothetical protein